MDSDEISVFLKTLESDFLHSVKMENDLHKIGRSAKFSVFF